MLSTRGKGGNECGGRGTAAVWRVALAELADALARARAVVVLTGAGVSAESGVPTFRDARQGLWARYDPEQLATPDAFARDPALVTRWYDERRLACLACEPNAAHRALAALETSLVQRGASFQLLTQNVDRLHHRAGSERVVELHGSLAVWRCTRSGQEVEPPPRPFQEYPPRSAVGGLLRPGVVWFGELLPAKAMLAAEAALAACDLFLSVGTSAMVYPAAGYAEQAAAHGARTAEINPEPTPISRQMDWSIRARAGEVLPRLVELVAQG